MSELDTNRWWESRRFALAMVLASTIPLLWPAIPPLTDLPGHMGRWYISIALGHSPDLQRYYDFHWGLLGNLGMDLLVPPIARLIGIEPASKLAVTLVPMLTVAGLLWTAREAHGRIPPTILFALPLAYAWPFQMGFINFTLSQALALLALGLWLRLGRTGQTRLRAALFVPIAAILWVTHDFGWGMFGLFAFGTELARQRGEERGWPAALAGAVLACLPLALPGLFMLLHPNDTARGNNTGDWFNWLAKLLWFVSTLRDRWDWFDKASMVPILFLLYFGARDRRMGLSPLLLWPALLCLIAFLLLPRLLLGGAYVDMRMMPPMLMLLLAAIRPPEEKDRRIATLIALSGLVFLAVRTTATTISFALRDRVMTSELAAIDLVPRGSAVLVLATRPCKNDWDDARFQHLAGIAIIRRQVFVNEQWDLEGQQLLRIHYPAAAPFTADPSQEVYADRCTDKGVRLADALARFNHAAFGHVWTPGFAPRRIPGLSPIWTNGRSTLYRVTG